MTELSFLSVPLLSEAPSLFNLCGCPTLNSDRPIVEDVAIGSDFVMRSLPVTPNGHLVQLAIWVAPDEAVSFAYNVLHSNRARTTSTGLIPPSLTVRRERYALNEN